MLSLFPYYIVETDSLLLNFSIQQFNSLLSKNQVPISKTINDITIKSCEQGLITKVCIAMHTN